MLATASVIAEFSASHVVPGHSTCGKTDGHRWQVETFLSGQVNQKTGMVVDHGDVARALNAVISELDHRHLNDMLPGVVCSPEGLAAYIRERMILDFPTVMMVAVRCDTYRAVLEWPLR